MQADTSGRLNAKVIDQIERRAMKQRTLDDEQVILADGAGDHRGLIRR